MAALKVCMRGRKELDCCVRGTAVRTLCHTCTHVHLRQQEKGAKPGSNPHRRVSVHRILLL